MHVWPTPVGTHMVWQPRVQHPPGALGTAATRGAPLHHPIMPGLIAGGPQATAHHLHSITQGIFMYTLLQHLLRKNRFWHVR